MFLLKIAVLSLVPFFIVGCSFKSFSLSDDNRSNLLGFTNIEQNLSRYIDNLEPNATQNSYVKVYDEIYSLPYVFEEAPYTAEEIAWPFHSYRYPYFYGENLQKNEVDWYEDQNRSSQFEAFDTLKKYATTLHFTNLRSFPTDKPLFLDPSQAGEGFPFDYLQNSAIHANEPLYISHYNRDRSWVYVFTPYANGWLRVDDITFIPREYAQKIISAQKLFLLFEGKPLYNLEGKFLFYSRIGMSLPIIEIRENSIIALVVRKGANSAFYDRVELDKKSVSVGELPFIKENVEKIMGQFLGLKYGWGGMFENRDCSSTLRDIFAPFGIWLPRNSLEQSQVGRVISFEGLDDEQKQSLIVAQAKPFKTLLYKKGHILLYIGTDSEGNILVLHNMWGIRTLDGKVEGRIILGKTVITTLDVGSNQSDYAQESAILHSLKSMNIIVE